MTRTLIAAAFGTMAVALAVPASGQTWRIEGGRPGYAEARAPYYEVRRMAYDNGYREGLKEGQKERRSRDRFDYRDERTYQRGDKGYRREYGDRDRYRQLFRAGYADGYAEAYRRAGYREPRGGPGWGRNDGWYGNGNYGGYGGYGADVAFEFGARDGYEKGVEDARKRRSHDMLRHKWYRSGDRHYENRYGPRQQYADRYRQGFRQGYERGYRSGVYR